MGGAPGGYRVGAARASELDALEGIEVAAAVIFPEADLAPELRRTGLPLTFFQEAAREGRLWTAVLCASEEPVGFALASVVDGCGHLYEMSVHPDHARRGLGRALAGKAIAWARQSGFPALTLTTFRHLPWNAPFYRTLGFEEVPERALGEGIAELLAGEASRGLDPVKRVAMRRVLEGTPPGRG